MRWLSLRFGGRRDDRVIFCVILIVASAITLVVAWIVELIERRI
jgi:hypothetical protein